MTLIRWNPYRDMVSLRNALNRMFDDSFARSFSEYPERERYELTVPLDMYEVNGTVMIKSDLPGIKAEDIDINVVGNTLTIKGEFKSKDEDGHENVHIMERRFGKFSRMITLPEHVDTDNIEAEFEDGVLVLSLPKSEQAKPKQISVKSKS